MTAEAMWAQFVALHPEAAYTDYEAWAYGDAPDALAALTLQGIKTATSSLAALYGPEEPLPRTDEYSVILDGRGEAVCVTRTSRVTLLPFNQVSEKHAWMEGEGPRTLPHWRAVHERFFRAACQEARLAWTPTMDVVCEEFEVVYP